MNHISMPLCIVLIALMYFILREPCPCDEEDKNRVVEGLDNVVIGVIIGLLVGFLVGYLYAMSKVGNVIRRLGGR
jgi:NhaP-type Na+/H+ or K+/H+ antiporter